LKLPRYFLLVCIGTILCLSSGCNDAPDPVGVGTQPQSDFGIVRVDTLYTTAELSTRPNLLFTGSIDRVMLGKYQANQNPTYEAWTCLKFYGWPDSLLGVSIVSATVQLKPFYNFGDSLSSLSIDVFRAKANVQGDSLTYDSLNLNGSHYYDGTRISNPVTIQASDTLCSISLDTAVVREWFISNKDTTNRNDGLIIRPAIANVIKGFYSCNAYNAAFQPTLSITYLDTNGVGQKYTHKTGLSKYVSHVDPNLFVSNTDGKMRVQNGISYNGILALNSDSFDSLARRWPFTIHQAIIQITLDSASSSCRFTPFENGGLYGLSVGNDNIVSGISSTPSEKLVNSNGQRVYQFNVKSMLPAWIKKIYARKIAFAGNFESGSFDLFTFFSSESITDLKPKLIITYRR
jgi:hypothetical protein